jgi:hypothetical protein
METDADPAHSDGADDSNEVLRAKYLEYCSAQLADLLLYLSPDEIYLLAQKATRESGAPVADAGSYTAMVEQATRLLARRVNLPPFDVWREDYRANRERYEAYFMGLWQSEAPGAGGLEN